MAKTNERPQYEMAVIDTAKKFTRTKTDLVWAHEKQFMIDALGKNATLQKCTIESIQQTLLQIASIGLSLNPVLSHVYLIPRRIQKDPDVWAMYPSPSYRGLVHLAITGGGVSWVVAEVVYKGDEFQYRGPADKVHHIPNMNAIKSENNAIGVYCMAKTADGDILTTYMDRETVQRIRKMSDRPEGIMWNPDKLWTEGWKKAVIRRASKLWPRPSQQLTMATGLLNEYEGLREDPEGAIDSTAIETISDAQIADLVAVISEHGFDVDKTLNKLATISGVDNIKNLPKSQVLHVSEFLTEAIRNKEAAAASK